MRCGELCKSCGGRCREQYTNDDPAGIECPVCGGDGCGECDGGTFWLRECPSKFIGQDLVEDLQVVTSTKEILPSAGGLLDQSAWWFELRQTLQYEENQIEEARQRRRNARY